MDGEVVSDFLSGGGEMGALTRRRFTTSGSATYPT